MMKEENNDYSDGARTDNDNSRSKEPMNVSTTDDVKNNQTLLILKLYETVSVTAYSQILV